MHRLFGRPLHAMLALFAGIVWLTGITPLPLAAQPEPTPTTVFLPLTAISPPTLDLEYAAGPGTAYRTSVAPLATDDFAQANFSLWIPGDVPVVRGVIVYAPGCGASSLTDEPARARAALARKWHLGFVGMQFSDKAGGRSCGWSRVASGSPEAFQRALEAFAQQAGRPELAHAPVVFFGVSGGSGWASNMALRSPERTYVVYARGFGPGGTIPEAALGVPMLLNGKSDGSYGTLNAFQNCRAQGALCALNVDPGGEPSLSNQWERMALPYFDAVLSQRMPVAAPTDGPVALRAADAQQAWLGVRSGFSITAAAGFSGDPLTGSWLPDEGIARRWQDYNARGVLSSWTP